MQHVISQDGTAIGYTVAGAGPPLLLVHGVTLPDQQHIAMDTDPELFTREVVRFLLG
jgi:hypothetical protein